MADRRRDISSSSRRYRTTHREVYDARGLYDADDVKLADGQSKYGKEPLNIPKRSDASKRVAYSAKMLSESRGDSAANDPQVSFRTPGGYREGSRNYSWRSAQQQDRRLREASTRASRSDSSAIEPYASGSEIVTTEFSEAGSRGFGWLVRLVLLLAIAAVIVAVVVLRPSCSHVNSYQSTERAVSEAYAIAPATLDGVPPACTIEVFSLTATVPPVLDNGQAVALQQAIAAVEAAGPVGFVAFNAKSGFGVSYAPTTQVFSAASLRPLYCLFVCEQLIDGKDASLTLDSPLKPKQILAPGQGYELDGSYTVRELITDAVVEGSLDAFNILRDNCDALGWNEWVTNLGAQDCVRSADTIYAWQSSLSAARLWTEAYCYINSAQPTETAKFFKATLQSTKVSYIREACSTKAVKSMSAVGYNYGDDARYHAVCENGIFTMLNQDYVVCIMTGMEYSEDNLKLFKALSAAIADVATAQASS